MMDIVSDDAVIRAAEPGHPGRGLIRLDAVGTGAFAIASAVGATVKSLRTAAAIVAIALFAVGVFTFIWSYALAVERSRTDEVGVANMYLLTGTTAPKPVKRVMSGLLLGQTVICIGAAAVGFAQLKGAETNPLAFGILVPMFGMGLNGLWASRHGAFGPRILTPSSGRKSTRRPSPDPEHTSNHV